MISNSPTTRLARFYGRRRAWFVAGIALFWTALLAFVEFKNWHTPTEYGRWLTLLLATRTAPTGDLGVEIVGFSKSFDPAGVPESLLKDTPALRLMAEVKGVAYDRRVYAAVLDRLAEAGAKQVVFDFLFEKPGALPESDAAFAESLRRHRGVAVLAFDYSFSEVARADGLAELIWNQIDPHEPFLDPENPEDGVGFANFWPDATAMITRAVPRMSLEALARPGLAKIRPPRDMSLAARAASRAGAKIPDDTRARLINFAGPAGTFPVTPVHDLFIPDRWKNALRDGERFRGKIIVVGPYSEINYKDRHLTPFGVMSGAEVQANCVRSWLKTGCLREPIPGGLPSVALGAAWAAATALALVFAGARGVAPRFAAALSIPALHVAAAHFAFAHDIFLPLLPAVFAALIAPTCAIADLMHAQHERRRVRNLFGAYLAPAVVERMIASGDEPELGGEQVALTALFADVRRFTAFSETLPPTHLVTLMNEFLGEMTVILEEEGGALDKYVGDGIVAMFGAPVKSDDHARHACVCVIRMQDRLAALRREWTKAGGFRAEAGRDLRMRVGLNTGPAVVGNMGSAKRFNYTMMGDTVNLASRCESDSREFGVLALVTAATVTATRATPGPEILFRRLGRWRVKGREGVVDVYEIAGFADEASPGRRACVAAYETGLELFFLGKFTEAEAEFTRGAALESHMPAHGSGAGESPSERMIARCAVCREHPPAGGKPEALDRI